MTRRARPKNFKLLDVDWHERLTQSRFAGFDFVEISIDESDERLIRLDWSAQDWATLRRAIADTGIPITTMCLSGHRKYPLGSVSPNLWRRGFEIMHKAIDFAVDIGVRVIQLAGYYVYCEPHDKSCLQRYEDGLLQALEWASKVDVMLALENVDGSDVDLISQVMYFVDKFKSPVVPHLPRYRQSG